ncbi:MAG: putative O-glycosylation ligase, exosortase A system-associated, partial [Rubrivivax sp.]|nr:putative O-glycosylation ligase, exosortase A system-associated [Rubrivivax sp.]
VAVATLLGLLATKVRQNPFLGAPVWALLAFTIWICITLPFSFYLEDSLQLWERSMKIFLMIFVTLSLIDDRKKLDVFVWAIVISIGFYGVKGGLFTLATAGNYRVWGPGGFIGGNNELALALVATIPLMRYLQMQMVRRWMVLAMGVAMALTAITVLGTYSRGALLAIAVMAVFLWLKGDQKVLWGVVLVALGIVIVSFMPEQWWARMETILTYEQDDSSLGRINAWWMAWNLALHKPFGGGFMIYLPEVFQMYSPDPGRVHAAHSIYFQVLGEHGFVGLFLFLLVGVLTWTTSNKLIKAARSDAQHKWAADLGAMVQVSLIGFAAGGAFLSLAYFDLPYNLMVIGTVALHLISRTLMNPTHSIPEPVAHASTPRARTVASTNHSSNH